MNLKDSYRLEYELEMKARGTTTLTARTKKAIRAVVKKEWDKKKHS